MSRRDSPQTYLLSQIALHDKPNDLWMVVYNKVYDITSFAGDHPGGVEVLFDCGGVDATAAFEDVAHSENALNMLEPYYVGELHKLDCVAYEKALILEQDVSEEKRARRRERRLRSQRKQFIERMTLFGTVALLLIALTLYVRVQKVKWES